MHVSALHFIIRHSLIVIRYFSSLKRNIDLFHVISAKLYYFSEIFIINTEEKILAIGGTFLVNVFFIAQIWQSKEVCRVELCKILYF
jgi:hypothetical protein